MKPPPLDRIAELLADLGGPTAFASKSSAPADDLHLEVKGVGVVRMPVSRAQAERLCAIARPARYGQGERTLLDRSVRDTWEIPKSRVRIDKRRWRRTLDPMLERIGADLGLPEGARLEAELHSVLVYAPGQFFRPHKDSEKADDMVATLVVTLPSTFRGGSLVIEHGGDAVTSRGSKTRLSFVAFYSDCQHEVRPVTEGHRVSLTYNLRLTGEGHGTGADAPLGADPETRTVELLAEPLREHFTTPLPSRRFGGGGDPPDRPADRLVFLLDHEYTERGLSWQRLKGEDAERGVALRAAAERADCEAALALAEVHETWHCMEEGWDEPWSGRRRRRHWERDEDGDWNEDEPLPAHGPDSYTLVDLVDSGVVLHRWLVPSAKKVETIHTRVSEAELCYATPSKELEPYESEYEGYMGNYGNTMDRWYRRAAVVLWPRERAFIVRAEASPAWAVQTLVKRVRSGSIDEVRGRVESLLEIWESVAAKEAGRRFLDWTLEVAEGLDDPEGAAALLRPFRVEALTPQRAPALAALLDRYGPEWTRALLSRWSGADRLRTFGGGPTGVPDRATWLCTLPRIVAALREADEEMGSVVAGQLLAEQWSGLRKQLEGARALLPPSERDLRLERLGAPVLALLEAATSAEAEEVRNDLLEVFGDDEDGAFLPCILGLLRMASASDSAAAKRSRPPSIETLHDHARHVIEARLSMSARAEGDWSLDPLEGCSCELCGTLSEFLAAPDRTSFEWPLAQQRRRHVHEVLNRHGLPVRHETRRRGSPYTLVLTKTKDLFDREAAERRAWAADLEWLNGW